MASEQILSRKDIRTLGLRTGLAQSAYSYERMMGIGWTHALLPYLERIYKDDKKGLSASMRGNMELMSTNPVMSSFLAGLIISFEEKKEERSLVDGLRIALFGPLAGIGDALFWFTVLPIVAGICASFAEQGSFLGPALFVIIYLSIYLSRMWLAELGYSIGTKAIDKIKDMSRIVTSAATTLGVTVIGGLIASYVHIDVAASIPVSQGHAISLQTDFFDKILPNFLPLGYTLFMFYLLKKKHVSPVILILVTFGLAILCSFLGIL